MSDSSLPHRLQILPVPERKNTLTEALHSHGVMLSNLKLAKPSVLFLCLSAKNIDGGIEFTRHAQLFLIHVQLSYS
jgi:hypothetical protein